MKNKRAQGVSSDGSGGGLVYSTEHGRLCPDCGASADRCVCRRQKKAAPSPAPVPRDGVVRVGRETKGRKGAGITVITGAPLGGAELAELCTRLKKKCGSGGTVRDGVIEIQGDHRDTLIAELASRGWTVKRVGG